MGGGIWGRLSGYVGGLLGGLFLAFSKTFWGNAVEAEVYGLAMFLMLLLVYLALLWVERRGSGRADRLLVLMGYLAFLSIGVHMTVFLVVPVIFLLVVFVDREKLKDFRFWVSGGILALVMITLEPFLILVGLWLVLGLVVLQVKWDSRWLLSFMLVLVALVGFSTHLYIPISSGLDPSIDENNPSDWPSFKYFLERKQYGQQSMVERMFYRRGSLGNQFGIHPRMGFWGFFREQYTNKNLWFLPALLGGFGLWSGIKRRRKEGIFLLLLLLLSSVGLVLYMNFADGTRPDLVTGELIRLEVRDRDYFFTPAFVFFGILLGLGGAGLLRSIGEMIEKYKTNRTFSKAIGYGVTVLLLFLPLLAFTKNYNSPNNRRNNYIPYDYAYNILNSCEKDAIIFTNGDNDTFPLWFIQEVEGVRKDVRVVNLSLLNADWYILQLKNQMDVPIDLEDEHIKWVEVEEGGRRRIRPKKPFYDKTLKATRYLFPYYDQQRKRGMQLQDQMILIIHESNQWKYPVYFSATVTPNFWVGLDSNVVAEAFAYRIVPEKGYRMVNDQRFHHLLWDVYQYRGIDDLEVNKDEVSVGLLYIYPEKFIELASYYFENDQKEKGFEQLEKAIEINPYYYRTYIVLSHRYNADGEEEKSKEVLKQGVENLKKAAGRHPYIVAYHQYFDVPCLSTTSHQIV